MTSTINTAIIKPLFAAIGAAIGYLQPTIPFGLICTLAVFADCFTAWQLAKRVAHNRGKASAPFTSRKMAKTFNTIIKVYLLIVLAFLVDTYIFTFVDLYLSNITAGAFCFCQIWSILENESSENDARWARLLQKIMISKVSRHIDITEADLRDRPTNTPDHGTDNH